MSEEANSIYTAICNIMGEVGAIGKNQQNPQQRYKFRGIDDVYLALQPLFIKYRVFPTPRVVNVDREERVSKSGGALTYTILTVELILFAEDGSSVSATGVGEGMDSSDKSALKAMSGAYKNILLEIFCIPTQEPKDSENESPEAELRRPTDQEEEFGRGGKPADVGTGTATGNAPVNADHWRKKAMALGGNAPDHVMKDGTPAPGLNYSDEEIKKICYAAFYRYEQGKRVKDEKGNDVKITSRKQMLGVQWQQLAEEFENRLKTKEAQPPPEGIPELLAGLEALLGPQYNTLKIRQYLESVYICDLSKAGDEKWDAIKANLQTIWSDEAIQRRFKSDVSAYITWRKGIEERYPDQVDQLILALSDTDDEIVDRFFIIADAQKIADISVDKWDQWQGILESVKNSAKDEADDIPFGDPA